VRPKGTLGSLVDNVDEANRDEDNVDMVVEVIDAPVIYLERDPRSSPMPYKPEIVAADIRKKISSKEWPPGHRLPSTKELLTMYSVGYGTLREALKDLKREGLIDGRQGDGVYVAGTPTG
jgi:GntR family transcriptional regulator